jgi:hypothetical protein
MSIEPFSCSATQTSNMFCILGIVVGDSLSVCLVELQALGK